MADEGPIETTLHPLPSGLSQGSRVSSPRRLSAVTRLPHGQLDPRDKPEDGGNRGIWRFLTLGAVLPSECLGSGLGLVLAACAAPALAASFDCAKASSPMETAICADPKLSQADDALTKLYRADLAQLSPTGQASLRASERSWLAFARILCQPGGTPLNAFRWQTSISNVAAPILVGRCLQSSYRDRHERLAHAILRNSGRIFLSTTRYRVRPAHGKNPNPTPDAVEWLVTLLQIDAPKIKAEAAWNAQVAKDLAMRSEHPDSDGDAIFDGDMDLDASVSVMLLGGSPTFIISTTENSVHYKGDPRPAGYKTYELWSLAMDRPVYMPEIFQMKTAWRSLLIKYIFDRVSPDLRKRKGEVLFDEEALTEISIWSVTRDGLVAHFDPDDVTGDIKPQSVVIPWSVLKPYLNPHLPFDPAAIQSASS